MDTNKTNASPNTFHSQQAEATPKKDLRVLAAEGAIRDAEEQAYCKKQEIRAARRAALHAGSTSSAYKRHKKREAKEQIAKVERECKKRITDLQTKITEFYYEQQQEEYRKFARSGYGVAITGGTGASPVVSSSNAPQINSSPTKTVSIDELERLVRHAEEKQKKRLAKRSLESKDD